VVFDLRELNLKPRQIELLRQIHLLAIEMENIDNSGRRHALIALIEELSDGCISEDYIREKLNLLFEFKPKFSFEY